MNMAEALSQLEKGKRYRLRHRIMGVQRYDRKSVLVYIGANPTLQTLTFSGRDFKRDTRVAGTEEMPPGNLIEIKRVADDADLYINARWH